MMWLRRRWNCIEGKEQQRKQVYVFSVVMLMVLCFVKQFWFESIGPLKLVVFIAPVMVYVLRSTLRLLSGVIVIRKLLLWIAGYSTFFWMIHSLIHNGIPQIQALVYLPKVPLLILIWTIILMTPISMVLKYLKGTIIRRLSNKKYNT